MGFAVFASDKDCNQSLVGYAARAAATERGNPWRCGVTDTSGYGMELVALTWAMLWAHQDRRFVGIASDLLHGVVKSALRCVRPA